ncbi:translation initiation factor eIF2B subunit alpha-like [Liolophura sinensis]|uniref:translation initiation factor eIF2B subunit alpha-like n=1 Tax=Liolophura sinensis TaxID=3198878 RepID=UPI0031595F0C
MDKTALLRYFEKTVADNPEKSRAIAAIQTLIEYLKQDSAETLSGLRANLKDVISTLTETESNVTSISSGCELFLRFITLTGASLESSDFNACKKLMVDRGNLFLQKVATSRQKISKLAHPFILDGATILTHSRSRVVLHVLKEAAKAKKRFNVFVMESQPDKSGHLTCKELTALGIPCTVILDSAVGYVMEKVDICLVGAEGVVENGGIINKIGTFALAISAREMNKPVYVLAESFKFVRLYPLNQQDIPNQFKYQAKVLKSKADLDKEHPLVDYTPPLYISLLFTDLGILTPSAVSDELIKLYL